MCMLVLYCLCYHRVLDTSGDIYSRIHCTHTYMYVPSHSMCVCVCVCVWRLLTRAELSEDDKLCISMSGMGWRSASSSHQLNDVRMITKLTLNNGGNIYNMCTCTCMLVCTSIRVLYLMHD